MLEAKRMVGRTKRGGATLWPVLMVATVLVAASCGGADNGESNNEEVASGVAEEFSGEELTVMGVRGEDEPEGEAIVNALKVFTEETGIAVRYEGVGDELPTVLSTRVDGGSPPDVALLPQPGLLEELAIQDALQDVSDSVGPILERDFQPIWEELGSYEGTLHGVYYKAANKSTVFYRLDSFEDLDLQPPTTIEEWVELNQVSTDNGVTPIAVGGADGWTLSDWFENIYVRSAGKDQYNQLLNHEISWEDDSVKEALDIMESLIGQDENVAGERRGALLNSFTDSVSLALKEDPEALMVYEGDFVAGIAQEETGSVPGEDFDFFAFPAINDSPDTVVGGGDVAVALGDNLVAVELLKFMASTEFAELMISAGGFTSPNNAVSLDLYPDEISRKSAESLVNAEVFVFDLSDSVPAALGATEGAGIWGGFQDWLEDPSQVDEVLAEIEKQA